jgi:hypothetical protein
LKGAPPNYFGAPRFSKPLNNGYLEHFQSSDPENPTQAGNLPSRLGGGGESAKRALDLAFENTRQIQNIK